MELAQATSRPVAALRRPMRYRLNPYATSARAVYVSCSETEECDSPVPSVAQQPPQRQRQQQPIASPHPHVSVLDDGGCCGDEMPLIASPYGVLSHHRAHPEAPFFTEPIQLVHQQQQQQEVAVMPMPFPSPAARRINGRMQQQQQRLHRQQLTAAAPMSPYPVGYAHAPPPSYVPVQPPVHQQQPQYVPQQLSAVECACCSPAAQPFASHAAPYHHHNVHPQVGPLHFDRPVMQPASFHQQQRASVFQRHQRCDTGMSAISGMSSTTTTNKGAAHYHGAQECESFPCGPFGSSSALDVSSHDCMALPGAASPSPTQTPFSAGPLGALRRRRSPLETVLAAPQAMIADETLAQDHHPLHDSCGRSSASGCDGASLRSHHSESSSRCAGTSGSDTDLTAPSTSSGAAAAVPAPVLVAEALTAALSATMSKSAKKKQAAVARAARAAAAAATAATLSSSTSDETTTGPKPTTSAAPTTTSTDVAAAGADAPVVPPLSLPDCLTVPWPLSAAPHAFRLSHVPLPEELALPAEASGEGRYKQLCHGYTSAEYAKYRAAVPRHERQLGNPNHPLTPRADCASTRRAFRDLVFRWRQDLHRWDALPDAAAAHAEGLPTLLEAGLEPAVRPDSPRPRDLARRAHVALGHSEDELRELGLLEL